MPNAQLSQYGIDGSHLHTFPPTRVAQTGGFDVIAVLRHQKRQRPEPSDDAVSRPRRDGPRWAG